MEKNKVRLIKISREALHELIYETFVEKQSAFLDVNPTEVSDYFAFDPETGAFLFCAANAEDENGNPSPLPPEIDLQKVMQIIPDTTDSVFTKNRYREYTTEELTALSE